MSPETLALEVRDAARTDAVVLWAWRNDHSVRRASFHGDWISWDAHCAWLAARLDDPSSRLYVVELDGLPAAQVRFDLDGDAAEISVSVAPAARGRGVGTAAVRQACLRVAGDTGIRSIVARVKNDNMTSLRLFEKAGFHDEGEETVAGCEARRLRLDIAGAAR